VVELNKVNATIRKGRKLIKVHANRIKPFYRSGRGCREVVSSTYILLQRALHQDLLVLWILIRWLYCPVTVTWGISRERFDVLAGIFY